MKIRYRMRVLVTVAGFVLLPAAFAQSPHLTPLQKRHLSGFVSHELDEHAASLHRSAFPGAPLAKPADGGTSGGGASGFGVPTAYTPSGDDGCSERFGPNVKVNQDCLNISDAGLQGRGQAQNETAIAEDPNHPNHIVAAFNDYRRGDGTCGYAYSLDGGRTWADGVAPIGFTSGVNFGSVAREYWQASGDPAVAWDTQGNAYLACQAFMRGVPSTNNPDFSSAVYVFRSTHNRGGSWNFPGRPVVEDYDTTGATLQDKPYLTIDNHLGSPFQDRIYVTWTNFAADSTAYLYESYSADYGEHFSAPVLVSTSSVLCTQTYGLPTPLGTCNENQNSQPFTGPDGALYVVYDNYNSSVTGTDNRNQILLVKSTDGGATFGTPVKVSDYYDLPDCYAYQGQNAFRACVPEKGPTAHSVFRADNYPSGAVNPTNPQQVTVSFGSYINRNSNEGTGCTPAGFSSTTGLNLFTGVKTPGACANQILLSTSTDGGANFTGGSQDPRVLPVASVQSRVADAFWEWAAYTPSGAFAVSYYDRQYGTDSTTGSSDVSASWTKDGGKFRTVRATSSSMPPPTQFSGLFYGDYAGFSAVSGLHPIWMDTRNAELFVCPGTGLPLVPPQLCTATEPNGLTANDQEVFTITLY